MNILLDTCTFLWITLGSDRLSGKARELFTDPGNEVFLSVVSSWEMTVKWNLRKLSLPVEPARFIPHEREQHLIAPLPLAEEAVFHLPKLPDLHRDPFDRMLICQAIEDSLVILTPDPLVTQYPVRTIW